MAVVLSLVVGGVVLGLRWISVQRVLRLRWWCASCWMHVVMMAVSSSGSSSWKAVSLVSPVGSRMVSRVLIGSLDVS